jgi:hypothetical protein
MRRLCRTLAAVSLAFTFASPLQLWGWGNSGHESVAYVAWKKMTPATRTRIMVLLKQVPSITPPLKNGKQPPDIPGYKQWVKDLPPGLSASNKNLYLFMRAATWADSIKHAGLIDSDTPPAVPTDVNIGFTDTASHGYWHFIDTPFSSDHTNPTTTPSPNVVTQIVAFRTAIASVEDEKLKAYDLIFLEHLVGDIHQPLHATDRYFAGKEDIGGNDVNVTLPGAMKLTFEGTLGKRKKEYPKNLHAFWDDLPGEGNAAPALGQAASYAKALAAAPATGVADTDPANWAAESFALAQSDAYTTPIGPSPEPTTGTSKSYLVTTAYYTKASQDAKARIALAGVRLAKLIEDNLK